MNEYNWHNWGSHVTMWILWIAIAAGLWLIYKYVIKSIKQNSKGKNGEQQKSLN